MVVRAYPARMASAAPLIDCLVLRLTLFIVKPPFPSMGTCSALLAARVHVERCEDGGERGGRQEHPADERLLRFEDDHRNRSFGPLLVAGVALEHRGDPGPELTPLLFGGGAGDHEASRTRHSDSYLRVSLQVEVPGRVPVI